MKQLPLKLVPFEELFLLKHRADYPATFFAFFEFSQPLDRELAELAFKAACQKHPLVRARVERRAKGFWWKPTDQPLIHWSDKPVGLHAIGSGNLDIEQEPGIKVWAFDGQVGQEVAACMQFVIHHVALDGLGFLQFYGDWLKFYQQLQRSPRSPQEWVDVDEAPIPTRCRPTLGIRQSFKLLPGQWKSVRATLQILRRVAIPLTAWKQSGEVRERVPSVVRTEFSADETYSLKQYASAKSASLNSILLRDLFVAIDQWQATLSEPPEGTHLRLMVPINERSREHRQAAACNHCTMINLDRTRDEIRDSKALLASIEQEMNVIHRWKLSLNFWRALSLFRRLPGGLKRFASNDVSTTALVTNVGRLKPGLTAQPGSDEELLKTTDIDFVAPLMFGTVGAFTIAYLHGTMKITLQYDSLFVTREQVERLVACFRRNLLQLSGTGDCPE